MNIKGDGGQDLLDSFRLLDCGKIKEGLQSKNRDCSPPGDPSRGAKARILDGTQASANKQDNQHIIILFARNAFYLHPKMNKPACEAEAACKHSMLDLEHRG
ncbi:hypothetical protein Anapl_04994 [Anas platyrhynchos]|uniref:Uncharacterized protein n=1 Tax=Anas platyrhynchos TaxID=8839 RepID=R0LGC4_ANAPL|nr:hypothetical protein Anapl_04994 [Anas platyrhynchos]